MLFSQAFSFLFVSLRGARNAIRALVFHRSVAESVGIDVGGVESVAEGVGDAAGVKSVAESVRIDVGGV